MVIAVKLKMVKWEEYVACKWEIRNARIILVREPEGKRPIDTYV
jgi:hypothetical protein